MSGFKIDLISPGFKEKVHLSTVSAVILSDLIWSQSRFLNLLAVFVEEQGSLKKSRAIMTLPLIGFRNPRPWDGDEWQFSLGCMRSPFVCEAPACGRGASLSVCLILVTAS